MLTDQQSELDRQIRGSEQPVVEILRTVVASRQIVSSSWVTAHERACAIVASFCPMQMPESSWLGAVLAPIAAAFATRSMPRSDQHGIPATVTSVSALVMGDLQTGLYFGYDLPFRRL